MVQGCHQVAIFDSLAHGPAVRMFEAEEAAAILFPDLHFMVAGTPLVVHVMHCADIGQKPQGTWSQSACSLLWDVLKPQLLVIFEFRRFIQIQYGYFLLTFVFEVRMTGQSSGKS